MEGINKMETIMETKRMRFIRPNERYVADMLSTLNNPEVSTFVSNRTIDLTEEDEIKWIAENQVGYNFSMITKDTEEFIGNCGFNDVDEKSGVIGIFLNPRFQNIGLGTEAITELIRFGFEDLDLEEIRLVVFSHNERAIRCYNRLGFREYKRETDIARRNNQAIDDIYMRLRR
jgi:RimJ/RimL family protein N-acetyltransferase